MSQTIQAPWGHSGSGGALVTRFQGTSPREIEQSISLASGASVRLRGRPGSYSWSMVHADAGSMHIDEVDGDALSVTVEPHDRLVFVTARRGVITRRTDRGALDEVGPGESVLLATPDEGYRADWKGLRPQALCLGLDLELLREVAGASMMDHDAVDFTGYRPVNAYAERLWQGSVEHVLRALVLAPGLSSSPLVVGESARFLAAATLATFPNTAMRPGLDLPDCAPMTQTPMTQTLSRAVDFIEENAHRALVLADIAAAAGVTSRAIQLAFRARLDTTPMAHLRRVRLERVHAALSDGSPDDGTTVTEVAALWGFCGSGRFTHFYREAYGCLPSTTLHARGDA